MPGSTGRAAKTSSGPFAPAPPTGAPITAGFAFDVPVRFDTDTLSINWSHAVGRYSSVNLGYAYRRTEGYEELDAYTANMINLSVSYSR